MTPGAEIIWFPKSHRTVDSETGHALLAIISAVHTMGEPAFASEIERMLSGRGLLAEDGLSQRIVTLLEKHSCGGEAIFRPVRVGETQAWAFSQPFRNMLSLGGLAAKLREIPAVPRGRD